MINIFQNTSFIGHSGQKLLWKVECDALARDDWGWAAARVAERITFGIVEGVPPGNAEVVLSGGLAFAAALEHHTTTRSQTVLLCDDVLTTGGSMEKFRDTWTCADVVGVVMFARIKPPPWVHAIWRFW